MAASVAVRPFGQLADGRDVHEYTLDNGRGLVLRTINLGGIVTAIEWPDRRGHRANVVLGFCKAVLGGSISTVYRIKSRGTACILR